MPYPRRLWVLDGTYHITARGNNRQATFLDSSDYQQYLVELAKCQQECPYRMLAFALMPNHVHLVLRASPDAPLSEVMQRVSANYTRYFNHRHGRVGHLYQGRFYSNLVDRDAYLMEVTRYVHRNPVRAQLAPGPADYLWSSYRRYLGQQALMADLVDPSDVLRLFGPDRSGQVARYREYVEVARPGEEAWVKGLRRRKLIPPLRWLCVGVARPAAKVSKVSDTFPASKSV